MKPTFKMFALAVAIASLTVVEAQASSIEYITPIGSTTGDGAVNAEAFFTLNNGSITVTLIDLLKNPTSDGQTISAITFKLGGATQQGLLTTANSGTISTINIKGTNEKALATLAVARRRLRHRTEDAGQSRRHPRLKIGAGSLRLVRAPC